MNTALPLNLVEKHFRTVVFIMIVSFAAVSVNSLIKAIGWIDKPFPGFLLYENSLVAEVSLSSWSGYVPGLIKSYDKVISVEGRELSPPEIYEFVSSKPLGARMNYTVLRDGKFVRLEIPTTQFGFGDFLSVFGVVYFVGLVIFATGVLVYFLKPELTSGKIFFMFCFSMGLWFTSIFDAQSTYSLGDVAFMAWMFTPAFCISLAFIFPSRKKFLEDSPLIILLPLMPSLALFASHLIFFDPRPVWWRNVDILTWVYALASTSAFIVSAAVTYVKADSPLEKERARVILLGAFLGFFVPAVGAFVFASLGISNLNSLAIPVLFFPTSIAYAIVKHKLFDVDIIIKGTLVYAILAGVVVGTLALTGVAFNLDLSFDDYGDLQRWALLVVLITFLVFILNPLKNRIQGFIDLTLFPTKYDYHRTIEEMSFAMISLLNLDEIAYKIINAIEQTISPNQVFIILTNETTGDYRVYTRGGNAGNVSVLPIKENSDLIQLLNRYREEIFKEDLIAEERYSAYRNKLMKLFGAFNAALFLPVFFKEQLIGVLCLGEKRNRLSYSSEDIKLLRVLANQSAIAIENAFAFKLVEDYARKLEGANRELQEAQMQLTQAEKMSAVGQLAAGIAHEIRNPLNIIEGARYYLSQIVEGENVGVVKEYLSYIKHEVDRTSYLIDGLLRFSKVEAPHFEPIDVNRMLEDILVLMRKQVSDAGVGLSANFDPRIPSVTGDQNQLWQVFINILMNAIQAMPGGGELKVETGLYYRGRDYVFISFTDTGIGIDKKDMSKIFNPFFTTKEGGTGLGLPTCYRIIEGHRGRITVNSEKGKGSTFVVELPAGHANGEISDKGVEDAREQKSVGG